MEHLAFNAYAYHQQGIEDFINYLVSAGDPNDFYAQRAAAQAAHLDMNSLTSDEIEYIEREVAKRWQN
jgi:hypothetical protein